MPISEIYEELRQIALSDYGDIVVQVAIMRLSTGDPLKLRLNLVDGSLIDVHINPEPTEALRQICLFARQKLRQESRS